LYISVVIDSIAIVAVPYTHKHRLDVVYRGIFECHVRRTWNVLERHIVCVHFGLHVHLEALERIRKMQMSAMLFRERTVFS